MVVVSAAAVSASVAIVAWRMAVSSIELSVF
jgi:hypothetical protein